MAIAAHRYFFFPDVQEIFQTLGPVGEIKIIKDKLTGLSAGYGFVQYLDNRCAEMALQSLNGRVLHGQVTAPSRVCCTHPWCLVGRLWALGSTIMGTVSASRS